MQITQQLMSALRNTLNVDEYALFTEVPASLQKEARRADAISISITSAREPTIAGYELKATREDWKRELGTSGKWRGVGKYCDYWWVVVPHNYIVDEGELHGDWGLMMMINERLHVIVAAPRLNPRPLDRQFLAGIARRAQLSGAEYCQNVATLVAKRARTGAEGRLLNQLRADMRALQRRNDVLALENETFRVGLSDWTDERKNFLMSRFYERHADWAVRCFTENTRLRSELAAARARISRDSMKLEGE